MVDPVTVNFTIYQGATFDRSWKIQDKDTGDPLDFSGWTARMHIREKIKSTTALLTLTTANNGISIDMSDPTETIISLYISPTDTASLDVSSAVYDLELVDTNNDVLRLMKGTITIDKEVTR